MEDTDRKQPDEKESKPSRMASLQKLKKLRGAPLGMLIIGILLIIYVSFGVVYFQKQGDIDDLETEIASRTKTLNALAPAVQDINQLQATLAQKQSDLESDRQEYDRLLGALPSLEEDIDIYDAILDLGHKEHDKGAGDVIITDIAEGAPKAGASGRIAIPYTLSVSGDRWPLLTFTNSIMNQEEGLLGGLGLQTASIGETPTITVDPKAIVNLLQELLSSRTPRVLPDDSLPFGVDFKASIGMNVLVYTSEGQ